MNPDRHTYEYDVDTTSHTAPATVIRFVGERKRVLELGCGPGSITKILAIEKHCTVTGADLDEESIKRVAPFCDSVFKVNLNDEDWSDQIKSSGSFDVVVAADVLEHLYDPALTLSTMTRFINKDGYIVISLPHVGHSAILGCLLKGDFSYRDWGLLDKTHIRFFCLKNIEELFFKAKLKIVDFYYVRKPAEDTEFAGEWATLSPQARTVLRSSPHADIYQVVLKAIPVERPGINLPLSTSNILKIKVGRLDRIKSQLISRLSPRAKKRIRQVLIKLKIS